MARRGLVGRQKNSSPSQDPVPLRGRGGSGRLSVSAGATAVSLSFILLSPAPGYRQLPFRGPLSCPKSRRERGGAGESVGLATSSPDGSHLPLNSPDKLCASQRTAPTATEKSCGPATSRPRCPVRVRRRRAQVRFASLCPSQPRGARGAQAAPSLGPDSPAPDGAYLLTWPGRSPGVPRGKADCPSTAAAEPQLPKEWVPVAGGGGAKAKSRRRRKGREGSAEIRAPECAQGRTEPEERRAP